MCAIEDNAPGGRLYDIDVYSERVVPYTRDGLALAQRPCLVCGGPAHFCARSRRHPLEEVLKETVGIMREALAGDIAAAAYGAMIRELRTTPKPGLVDRSNNGAHADMDYALFERSALAVSPYFKHMALYAMGFNGPPDEMLGGLRSIGLSAEEAMFSATGGVNTHKGLIFSFGLVCAAAAYLYTVNETADDGQLLRCAARIAAPSLDEMGACGDTHGQKIFLRHQLYGARGEAALGFPCVVETGLPALRRALAAGESENDAGVYALMHLMARLDDTNIIARSDISALRRVQAQAEALLEKGLPAEAFLREVGQMDAQFIAQNISAGGCADMLAVCWLVYLLSH
jgi:holo-ACP synthase/triphosphoribosyl-dephospho-CoA synthase